MLLQNGKTRVRTFVRIVHTSFSLHDAALLSPSLRNVEVIASYLRLLVKKFSSYWVLMLTLRFRRTGGKNQEFGGNAGRAVHELCRTSKECGDGRYG